MAGDVQTTMYFLARKEKYKTEKPYASRYDPEGAFPASNIEPTAYNVKIQNMRPLVQKLCYEQTGFQFAEIHSQMKYEDYADRDKIRKIHVPEVETLLKNVMEVPQVRRRHPTFPIATGDTYEYLQPGSRVHLETQTKCNPGASASMAVRKVSSRNSSELTKILITECNSVWHPLKGPLVDWPLAVCDASSVDFTADTMPGDVVGRDEVFENTQVHYNAEQRWYWLPDQLSSELMIFKNADSRSPDGMAAEGTPHAAFDNPNSSPEDFLRESIEIRFLLSWDT